MENISIIDKAVDLLNKELETDYAKVSPFDQVITHLINKAKEDEEFSNRVLVEGKSYENCVKFVMKEVMEILKNGNGIKLDIGIGGNVEDEEVYKLAERYYIQDDPKPEPRPEPKPISIPKNTSKKKTVQTTFEDIRSNIDVEKKEQEQISLFSL